MYKPRVYFASGWFTDAQIYTYDKLKTILDAMDDRFEVYYPKEGSADLQDKLNLPETRAEIFRRNVEAMDEADMLIVSTEDKDPGSIFEAGYAYFKGKPIVYVNLHLGKGKFNLMLTESAKAIATNLNDFVDVLAIISKEGLESPKLEKFKKQEDVE